MIEMATRVAVKLTNSARKGDVACQLELSDCYLHGLQGLPQSFELALAWLVRAKESGAPNVDPMIGQAIPWAFLCGYPGGADCIRLAAESGHARARRTMAHLMLGGQLPSTIGGLTAHEWLQKAVDAGNSRARADLEFIAQGEVTLRGLSHDVLDSFVGRGSTAAQLELALRQLKDGSRAAAEQALQRLAKAGNQRASLELAELLQGDGRLGEAVRWWAAPAQQGRVEAMLKLAACYMQSEGLRESGLGRSYKKAAAWLLRALKSGSAEAAYQLHLLYQTPGYSMRNAGQSQRYLGLASELGHAHAQFVLAVRMLRGVCGREARTDAAIWLKRAADQGHSLAAQKLSTFVSRTPIDYSPGCRQREALKLIGRKNLALAARLECGWVFGLSLLESIWVDFVRADRGVLLECDLSERGCRQLPVLVLIENDIQREALALVKRRSTLDVPGTDLGYPSRTLADVALRRYIERCGVEVSVFLRQNGFHQECARRSVA